MVSCEPPNHRLNYIFSCHLLAQVQVKVGKLEGERVKPSYKELLENPVLNYSGVFQHQDLYVTMQIFANNQPLCMPIRTSYKYIEKKPWNWDEWLTMPLRIKDLPRNSQLAITVWDIESPQQGDIPVCGATISLFDRYGEFRQGFTELRMWPNRAADGNTRTCTPGIITDFKENEFEDMHANSNNKSIQLHENNIGSFNNNNNNNKNTNNNNNTQLNNINDEFPMLDELDRLAKMSKFHTNGQLIKQDWLDRLTLREIQKSVKNEKEASKFFFLTIDLAQIKCDDTKYTVLYYEEDAEKIIQTIPTNELFVVNDPELEIDNIIELKHRKLEHSKQMGVLDMNLKPEKDNKNLLTKIVNYPVNQKLKREELTLLWKYRYYLTQNKKALTKVLQCFDLSLEFEKSIYSELILKWQPMDAEDALELLGSKYKDHPKIRSYAISRLQLASNEDLILYLLQLVQALRYENFDLKHIELANKIDAINSNNQAIKTSLQAANAINNKLALPPKTMNSRKNSIPSSESTKSGLKTETSQQKSTIKSINTESATNNSDMTQSSNINTSIKPETQAKNIFDLNLKSFLLERAAKNESVALCLYWYVKVEIKDTKSLLNSASVNSNFSSSIANQTNIKNNAIENNGLNLLNENKELMDDGSSKNGSSSATNSSTNFNKANSTGTNLNNSSKTNFQIFMDELLETLRTGDSYAQSIYESILNQEKFLRNLDEVVRAVQREGGLRDKKVVKLRSFLADTGKNSTKDFSNLINFDVNLPLILDPNVKIKGIVVDKANMFKSNLMPCKFVFKAKLQNGEATEYATIYKIGDDLRQDQLVLQMIDLMDNLLKQENLDLKLSPYKVVATGIKEGFVQFVDALPLSNILNGEYRTIKEYLKRNNPSETDKYGISSEAIDNYVRSSAGYIVITYILGVGDRHYDNILISKNGRLLHIDFGYILGRDPKPFQPIIKWTKDIADGMGGRYCADGKENKEYEDFKKYCCNAFLHLRRHANLILNLFSLMVDANIPDIALEPDKTVKKIMDRFKLDFSDEQAQMILLKEIDNNYDTLIGNITDIVHNYSTAQK